MSPHTYKPLTQRNSEKFYPNVNLYWPKFMLHVWFFWVIKFQAKCSFYQQRFSWLYYSQVISLLSIITVLQKLPCPTFFLISSQSYERHCHIDYFLFFLFSRQYWHEVHSRELEHICVAWEWVWTIFLQMTESALTLFVHRLGFKCPRGYSYTSVCAKPDPNKLILQMLQQISLQIVKILDLCAIPEPMTHDPH